MRHYYMEKNKIPHYFITIYNKKKIVTRGAVILFYLYYIPILYYIRSEIFG